MGDRRGRYPRRTKGTKLLYNSTAVSTSLEDTATETTFDNASYTLNGGKLRVGDIIEVEGLVWIEDIEAANSLQLKLYFGTEVVWDSTAIVMADNGLGYIRASITVTAVGSGGSISAMNLGSLVATFGFAQPSKLDNVAEDLSGDVVIKLNGKWSAAHAGNECECKSFSVKLTPVS